MCVCVCERQIHPVAILTIHFAVRWSNEAATANADIEADHLDVPAQHSSINRPGALDTHSLTVVLASLGGNALFFQKRPFLSAPSVLVLLCSLRVQHTRNTRNDTKPTKSRSP